MDGGKNELYEWMGTSVDRSEARCVDGWMSGYKGMNGWWIEGFKGR